MLADFREVEANFRALDRELRHRVAAWGGSKGELLDDVVGNRSSIAQSDQGRTFHAFYDFLLSPARQEEFRRPAGPHAPADGIGESDPRMRHIHRDWLEAGERTQATVRQLSEQLRRFLDDRVWLENRRVINLIRSIEATALAIRQRPPQRAGRRTGGTGTGRRPADRTAPVQPTRTVVVDSSAVAEGDEDLDAALLFEQVFIDRDRLAWTVRRPCRGAGQVDLAEVLQACPVEQGLAELVTYLALEDETFTVVFDERYGGGSPGATTTASTHATLPGVTFVSGRSAPRDQPVRAAQRAGPAARGHLADEGRGLRRHPPQGVAAPAALQPASATTSPCSA